MLFRSPEVRDTSKIPGKDKFKDASPLEPTIGHHRAHNTLAPQHRNTLQEIRFQSQGHTAQTEALFACV